MKYKAIIFDLDGTLLYTLEDLCDSVNYALEKLNLNKRTLDEIRNFVGNGIYKLIERATVDKNKIDNCFKIFKQHYSKNSTNKTKPYPNTIETLKYLKNKNIKLAILSNKIDFEVKKLANIYFKDIFDIVLGENEFFPKKPDAKAIYHIIESFNVKKDEIVLVGDSEVDINCAKNAQIDCISVSWGYKNKDFLIEHGAKIIIDDFDKLKLLS